MWAIWAAIKKYAYFKSEYELILFTMPGFMNDNNHPCRVSPDQTQGVKWVISLVTPNDNFNFPTGVPVVMYRWAAHLSTHPKTMVSD